MAAGDLVVNNFDFEFHGWAFGNGTNGIDIVQVVGLDDLPDLAVYDKDRALRHGQFAGEDLARKRVVTFELEVWGTSETEFRQNVQLLGDATVVRADELPLVGKLPGDVFSKFRVNVKCRKRQLPLDVEYVVGRKASAALLFEATDPRVYDNAESTASTGVTTSTGGLTFPLTFPLDFGGTGTSGLVDLTNSGNFTTPWQARIDGPVTNPKIENVTTGQQLEFALTVAAGEWITVDSDLRLVLLNGTSSRYSSLTAASSWWDLPAGTTQCRFSGTTAGAPSVTFTWRSARI